MNLTYHSGKWLISFLLVLIADIVFFNSFCASQNEGKQTGQHVCNFEKEISRTIKPQYLLYLPKDYGKVEKQWPLLLYLHGGLGRGNDIQKIMWYPIPKMFAQNDSLPFI